jgi:hypothetical protein
MVEICILELECSCAPPSIEYRILELHQAHQAHQLRSTDPGHRSANPAIKLWCRCRKREGSRGSSDCGELSVGRVVEDWHQDADCCPKKVTSGMDRGAADAAGATDAATPTPGPAQQEPSPIVAPKVHLGMELDHRGVPIRSPMKNNPCVKVRRPLTHSLTHPPSPSA